MKGLIEFDYVEVDGLFYPEIEIGDEEILDDMGRCDLSICMSIGRDCIVRCF